MNKRLKKKLAYYIASLAFNHETFSTLELLENEGIPATLEDAGEITDMAGDLFGRFSELSDGWQAAKKLQGKE